MKKLKRICSVPLYITLYYVNFIIDKFVIIVDRYNKIVNDSAVKVCHDKLMHNHLVIELITINHFL